MTEEEINQIMVQAGRSFRYNDLMDFEIDTIEAAHQAGVRAGLEKAKADIQTRRLKECVEAPFDPLAFKRIAVNHERWLDAELAGRGDNENIPL